MLIYGSSQNSNYGDRAISVLGLAVFQFCFWATSKHRKHIPWYVHLTNPNINASLMNL